jgi:hypothetical protein
VVSRDGNPRHADPRETAVHDGVLLRAAALRDVAEDREERGRGLERRRELRRTREIGRTDVRILDPDMRIGRDDERERHGHRRGQAAKTELDLAAAGPARPDRARPEALGHADPDDAPRVVGDRDRELTGAVGRDEPLDAECHDCIRDAGLARRRHAIVVHVVVDQAMNRRRRARRCGRDSESDEDGAQPAPMTNAAAPPRIGAGRMGRLCAESAHQIPRSYGARRRRRRSTSSTTASSHIEPPRPAEHA